MNVKTETPRLGTCRECGNPIARIQRAYGKHPWYHVEQVEWSHLPLPSEPSPTGKPAEVPQAEDEACSYCDQPLRTHTKHEYVDGKYRPIAVDLARVN